MINSEKPPISKAQALRARMRRHTADIANYTAHADARERIAESDMNPVRALVLRAILATPKLPEFIQHQVYGKQFEAAGLDIIGVGYHAFTVSDGPDRVRKFYRHTAGASETDQEAMMNTWREKHNILLTHLGEYTIPQVFSIIENPMNKNESIVTATQARVDGVGAISIWRPDEIPASANSFMSESLTMLDLDEPAVPDLMGCHNALIERHTGAVKLIDPIPLVKSDPEDEPGYSQTVQFIKSFKSKKEDA